MTSPSLAHRKVLPDDGAAAKARPASRLATSNGLRMTDGLPCSAVFVAGAAETLSDDVPRPAPMSSTSVCQAISAEWRGAGNGSSGRVRLARPITAAYPRRSREEVGREPNVGSHLEISGLEIDERADREARQHDEKHGGKPLDQAPLVPIRLKVAHDHAPGQHSYGALVMLRFRRGQ